MRLCWGRWDDLVSGYPTYNNIRATVHFYNSEDDIERFVAALKASRDGHHPGAGPHTP